MPTYEYRCGACGHEFEEFKPMTAARIRTCPACHRRRARRLIGTGGALIFKGPGFYATDYRSSSYKEDAKKDAPAKAKEPAAASPRLPAGGPCEGCAKEPKSCPKKKAK